MQAIRLKVEGSFNSFRIPSGIRYHRTFHIPTKTTLIGLLGSALGLEDKSLIPLSRGIITNALLETFSGFATDIWLITKLKTQGLPESSPIIREMLYKPIYFIYYSFNDEFKENLNGMENIKDLYNAFADPVYALSLGRSDELIQIKELSIVNLTQQKSDDHYFKNTIFPFNYKPYFERFEPIVLGKGQTFSLPQIVSIPTNFIIENGSIRKSAEIKQITVVYDRGIKVKERIDVWTDGEKKFFLY